MNLINLAGHLGADPEVRYTSSGKKVTNLRVATRARRGANQDDTIWWRVTLWGDQWDKMVAHLKKGSAVVVTGEIHKPEIYNDREGKPQVSMEVTAVHLQFSPFGKPGGQPSQQQEAQHQTTPAAPFGVMQEGGAPNPYMGGFPAGSKAQETFDDEVPF